MRVGGYPRMKLDASKASWCPRRVPRRLFVVLGVRKKETATKLPPDADLTIVALDDGRWKSLLRNGLDGGR